MPYPLLFSVQAAVLALVALTHLAALKWSLYWQYVWLDVPVHFAGGMWLALAASWLVLRRGLDPEVRVIFPIVIMMGVVWELFEIGVGVPREANFFFDTVLDLTMDVAGGILGCLIAWRLSRRDTMSAE